MTSYVKACIHALTCYFRIINCEIGFFYGLISKRTALITCMHVMSSCFGLNHARKLSHETAMPLPSCLIWTSSTSAPPPEWCIWCLSWFSTKPRYSPTVPEPQSPYGWFFLLTIAGSCRRRGRQLRFRLWWRKRRL